MPGRSAATASRRSSHWAVRPVVVIRQSYSITSSARARINCGTASAKSRRHAHRGRGGRGQALIDRPAGAAGSPDRPDIDVPVGRPAFRRGQGSRCRSPRSGRCTHARPAARHGDAIRRYLVIDEAHHALASTNQAVIVAPQSMAVAPNADAIWSRTAPRTRCLPGFVGRLKGVCLSEGPTDKPDG